MVESGRSRRWPAWAVAALYLGYAAGKAAFALQARLGFPGGPNVSAAEAGHYFMDAATAQWLASATGVLGACVALATVTAVGRRVPRTLMLFVLAGMLLAVGAGAAVVMVDGFVGIGVGWQWYQGVVAVVVIGLHLAMIQSYMVATRSHR